MKYLVIKCGKVIILAGLLLGIGRLVLPVRMAHAAFESGSRCSTAFYNSTSCRGAFSPTINTEISLPPDGIVDYTTFTVPEGVTITFKNNVANTPVIIRTSGDVIIEGTISVAGMAAADTGTAGGGIIGNDGQPGRGGLGGYDGGFGGISGGLGGGGKGPGGGKAGLLLNISYLGGSGGGFGATGGQAGCYYSCYGVSGGQTYGTVNLLPLVGGSGGGGGSAGSNYNGSGGGGGGGALMIASSGTITVGKDGVGGAGRILADGGIGGYSGGTGSGGGGGGGSGGAIKLVAETLKRLYDGGVYARGGGYGYSDQGWPSYGGGGGAGIIRLEANTMQWSGGTDPVFSFGAPGKLFVPNNPTLIITRVAGVTPTAQNGKAVISLPVGTQMPVTVDLAGTSIPRGTAITLYVVPAMGADRTSVLSTVLNGTSDAATTATAQVTIATGTTTLLASVTFTVTELAALNLPQFGGEYVAKIRVESELGGKSRVFYLTASGKEYAADGKPKLSGSY